MRNTSWLGITLTAATLVSVSIATIVAVVPARAQTVRNDDVASAMRRARTALEPVRQRLARAERSNQWEDRLAALADMKAILDEVGPMVESMAGDVEMQRAVHRDYDQWLADYKAANDATSAAAGEFLLMMSQRWKQISQPVQDFSGESQGATFDQVLQDSSIVGFGMPKTRAAVSALDSYLLAVQSDPDYRRYRTHPSVQSDLQRARESRDEARAKLADAAKAILDQATTEDLNTAKRERIRQLLEREIVPTLAGSGRIEELMARARALLAKPTTQPAERTDSDSDASSLTDSAGRIWPSFAGRYATVTGPLLNVGRGEMVELRDVRPLPADQYVARDVDVVVLIEGRPVLCIFDPVVKQHVQNILGEAGLKTLPQTITMIGMVRGVGTMGSVRQPGSTPATTNPAGQEGTATPQNTATLESRDGVIIDVLALHGGPLAIGVDPTPDQTGVTR